MSDQITPKHSSILSPREALAEWGNVPLASYVEYLDGRSVQFIANIPSKVFWEEWDRIDRTLKHIEVFESITTKEAGLIYNDFRLSSVRGSHHKAKRKGTARNYPWIETTFFESNLGGRYGAYSFTDKSPDEKAG